MSTDDVLKVELFGGPLDGDTVIDNGLLELQRRGQGVYIRLTRPDIRCPGDGPRYLWIPEEPHPTR